MSSKKIDNNEIKLLVENAKSIIEKIKNIDKNYNFQNIITDTKDLNKLDNLKTTFQAIIYSQEQYEIIKKQQAKISKIISEQDKYNDLYASVESFIPDIVENEYINPAIAFLENTIQCKNKDELKKSILKNSKNSNSNFNSTVFGFNKDDLQLTPNLKNNAFDIGSSILLSNTDSFSTYTTFTIGYQMYINTPGLSNIIDRPINDSLKNPPKITCEDKVIEKEINQRLIEIDFLSEMRKLLIYTICSTRGAVMYFHSDDVSEVEKSKFKNSKIKKSNLKIEKANYENETEEPFKNLIYENAFIHDDKEEELDHEELEYDSRTHKKIAFCNAIPDIHFQYTGINNDPTDRNYGRPDNIYITGASLNHELNKEYCHHLVYKWNPITYIGQDYIKMLNDAVVALNIQQDAISIALLQSNHKVLSIPAEVPQDMQLGRSAQIEELKNNLANNLSNGDVVVLLEGADLSFNSPNFDGLEEITESILQFLALISYLPMSVLSGTQEGEIASGEKIYRQYNEHVHGHYQKNLILPVLRQCVELLKKELGYEGDVDIEFPPTYQQNQEEIIDEKKNKIDLLSTILENPDFRNKKAVDWLIREGVIDDGSILGFGNDDEADNDNTIVNKVKSDKNMTSEKVKSIIEKLQKIKKEKYEREELTKEDLNNRKIIGTTIILPKEDEIINYDIEKVDSLVRKISDMFKDKSYDIKKANVIKQINLLYKKVECMSIKEELINAVNNS